MNNEETKICKKKGCNNIVLSGKYCEYCKKSGVERRGNALKVATCIAGVIALAIYKKTGKDQ